MSWGREEEATCKKIRFYAVCPTELASVHSSKALLTMSSSSQYIAHLDSDSLNRYRSKVNALGISDPYSAPQVLFGTLNSAKLPDLQYMDIINYLLFTPSPYTGQTLKAYKSTDAYKYYQAGWVKDVSVWDLDAKDFLVFRAKVSKLQHF